MFELTEFDVKKFDAILDRGLSSGLGKQGESVCIEAAICETLGLPHGDDPQCVSAAVRNFKIALNDLPWSSLQARAKGLRNLGIAQLGSLGVVDDVEFASRLAKKTISVLIPKLFREVLKGNPEAMEAADRCEKEGNADAARAAARAAYAAMAAAYAADAAEAARAAAEAAEAARTAAYAADAAEAARAAARTAADAARAAARAAYAAYAARTAARTAAMTAARTAYAAMAAARTAYAARTGDAYFVLEANLALETLRELNSPGVSLLEKER